MKVTCTMELGFPNEAMARHIAEALEADNAGYLEAKVEGRVILVTVEADNIMTLRNTLDDYLACATVAQKSLESAD